MDIQSWWEVPSIAHFCSLFRSSFNLLDFDIEDLEEALLSDGTEESSWLQDLIVRLLSGCLNNNEISTFNYQMYLRRLFRQKCQETDRYNPFNTDIDFQFLPLRTKVQILHALCDFRLDADDVLDHLKNLEADSLRVEPLGHDENDSAYWYFYGTRLYREDYPTSGGSGKKQGKAGKTIWQVICFTEDDWHHLAKKFKSSLVKAERKLYKVLRENFLPDLPRLFHEKEVLHRKRLLEWLPRRSSMRLDVKRRCRDLLPPEEEEEQMAAVERTPKNKGPRELRALARRSGSDTDSLGSAGARALGCGRQTNNSLASATGDQILHIQEAPAIPGRRPKQQQQPAAPTVCDEDLRTGMYKILEAVKAHDDAWPFVEPVEEEYAPNYYTVVRRPMDLQTMEDRLDAGEYLTFSRFKRDFRLIVDNCRLYNGADNEYTEMVDNLQGAFEKATQRYLDQATSSDEETAASALVAPIEDAASTSKRKKAAPAPPPPKRKPPPPPTPVKSKEPTRKETDKKKTRCKTPAKNIKPAKNNKIETKKKIKISKKDKKAKSPSPSWPPSSPEMRDKSDSETEEAVRSETPPPPSPPAKEKAKHWKEVLKEKKANKKDAKHKSVKTIEENKTKDKNIKLRETIEKLKEKNNLKEDESKPKSKKEEVKEKKIIEPVKSTKKLSINASTKLSKPPVKETSLPVKKCEFDFEDEFSDKEDISEKKSTKKPIKKTTSKNVADIDALEAATEQTLKDINKWLDDTPRFSEFSSASNSPSHFMTDEIELDKGPKSNKPVRGKEGQKRRFPQLKDAGKLPRRRELQRTIDRLQPGKSKGNLLSNVKQDVTKPEELFPLGPLAKFRDSKNTLAAKALAEDTGPKLSLGTVLDSFGQHKFSSTSTTDSSQSQTENTPAIKSESPKEEEASEVKEEPSDVKTTEIKQDVKLETDKEKPEVEVPKKEIKASSATPNLSAWFKAFGAPKLSQTQKKKVESEPEVREVDVGQAAVGTSEVKTKEVEVTKETVETLPEVEVPAGVVRQRRGSTGSSVSERSSFSQDMDSSPREERAGGGAYPAPYPSPLHRSPVSASPSPRQDPAYPALNGSIRVGFYQDTAKSSPCSPREHYQPSLSPYGPEHRAQTTTTAAPEHVYTYTPYGGAGQQSPVPAPSQYRTGYGYEATARTVVTSVASSIEQPPEESPTSQQETNLGYQEDEVPAEIPPPPAPPPQAVMFPVKKRALYNDDESSVNLSTPHDLSDRGLEQGLLTGRQLNLPPARPSPAPPASQPPPENDYLKADAAVSSYLRTDVRDFTMAMNKSYDNVKMFTPEMQHVQRSHVDMAQIQSSHMRMNFSPQGSQQLISNSFDPIRTVDTPDNKKIENMKLNMGYINAGNIDLTRTSPYNAGNIDLTKPSQYDVGCSKANEITTSQAAPQYLSGSDSLSNLSMRYSDSRLAYTMNQTTRTPQNISQRGLGIDMSGGSGVFKPTEMSIARPTFSTGSPLGMDMRGHSGLSHMVDRYSAEDRLLQGLQNTSYYADKGPGSLSHMFGKAVPTTMGTPSLPMFSQQLQYRTDPQQLTSASQDKKSSSRKRSRSKQPTVGGELPSTQQHQQQTQQPQQGFQSYAGLKSSSDMQLKSVAGSAFNLGGWGEQGASPLDPETWQARAGPTGYPLGGPPPPPYLAHTQATAPPPLDQPLYQQYLQSVGLLPPSPAYTHHQYHPALASTLRQPFQPMNRPWM